MNTTSTAMMIFPQDDETNHQHKEGGMVPFVYPNEDIDNTITKTLSNDVDAEEFSVVTGTPTPTTSNDWFEAEQEADWHPSDDEDYFDSERTTNGDDNRVNGTGLVLYVTPTATKSAYWKRRLGWKPQMAKMVQKRVKKALFRTPVRNTVRNGRSYEIQGADALVAVQQNKSLSVDKDRKRVLDDKNIGLEHNTNDLDVLGSVHHEDLVFA